MQRFLKITKRVVLVLAGLLFVFYAILFFRSRWAYAHSGISDRAVSVIKINVDELVTEYVLYKATHLGISVEYRKKKKEDEDKGISVPAHIFVYNVSGKRETTLFTSLPVSDSVQLSRYLIKEFKFSGEPNERFSLFKKNNGQVQVAFTNDRMMIAYTPSGENVEDIFASVLVKKQILGGNSNLFKKIKNADGNLALVSKSGMELKCELTAGKIEFGTQGNYSFNMGTQEPLLKGSPFVKDTTNALFMTLRGTPKFAGKNYQFKGYTLAYDSVSKYASYIQLAIKGTTIQQQKSITYEYNDDFEKVAVEAVKEVVVPDICLKAVASSKNGLGAYLTQSGIIKNDEINPGLFPLYRVHTNTRNEYFTMSTQDNCKDKTVDNTHTPFYLYVNFNRLFSYADLSMLREKVSDLSDLEVKMEKTRSGTYALVGTLKLKNAKMHPLNLVLR